MNQPERAGRRRLPPGSHGIPADVVARNQRERLVAAVAEECAEKGYAETSVAAIAKRAGVSTVTFYKQFADKQDCMLAAHEQLLKRLLERAEGLPEIVELLAADPPSARLVTVEILAVGSEGMKLHDAAVTALAERLGWDWVKTAGVLALIGKYVMAGEAKRLPELASELR
ncbi:MAG TPA: helix-turn-helix domain-containing protein [Solirubrobacterales bacterium]|nr:helix-turn-helix domain-containing protein [Solirubrobacterales bacterium]